MTTTTTFLKRLECSARSRSRLNLVDARGRPQRQLSHKDVQQWGPASARPRPAHRNDDVYVLLSLPDDPQRYPVAGKVAWITPARAANNRTQGVGIRFPEGPKAQALREKIEVLLGNLLASDRQTQTV